jgi:hypothetical protein
MSGWCVVGMGMIIRIRPLAAEARNEPASPAWKQRSKLKDPVCPETRAFRDLGFSNDEDNQKFAAARQIGVAVI